MSLPNFRYHVFACALLAAIALTLPAHAEEARIVSVGGSTTEIVYALGAAIEGHMEAPLSWPLRILLAAAGVALVWPNTPLLEIAGAIVVLTIFGFNIAADRKARKAAEAAG